MKRHYDTVVTRGEFDLIADTIANRASYDGDDGLEIISWNPLRVVGEVEYIKRVKDSRTRMGHYLDDNGDRRMAATFYGFDAHLDFQKILDSARIIMGYGNENASGALWQMILNYRDRGTDYAPFLRQPSAYGSNANYYENMNRIKARVNHYATFDSKTGRRSENWTVIKFPRMHLADTVESVLVSES
jgi:hypothetical protein